MPGHVERFGVPAIADTPNARGVQGAEAALGIPQNFGGYIAAEIMHWKKVSRDAGVKAE